jgi:hypothetical protein
MSENGKNKRQPLPLILSFVSQVPPETDGSWAESLRLQEQRAGRITSALRSQFEWERDGQLEMSVVVEDLIRTHIPEATAQQIAEVLKGYRMIARVMCEANVRGIPDYLAGSCTPNGDEEKP